MRNIWIRRILIGLSCLPVAVVTILHKMGLSGDYGVLGEWYVMLPLTALGVLALILVEKTVKSQIPSAPPAPPEGQAPHC
ncbi:hypothetical protein [Paractinoplanes brasiliensis]|uniref:Uncharacterized protein n=1 Tax=Paractinoplanes brasiliensis TaxID=52695 RepID=A0A4R6JCL0_9ACTN|nr:hypothetical protein [Actinoplanes brasiliensis]TDO32681.1 hypothetical protein C8E87_8152 [Actinoplanes brasiliensis]GID32814.1 hypothetical protein Abr02nite_77970 [Actinoplanes brasiliensis]